MRKEILSPALAVLAFCGCGDINATSRTPNTTTIVAATIVMSPDHYYFGVEKGSPLLRLETDTTTADVLNIRACKGFGVFQNNPVDLRLISYDPSSKVKELVTTFTEIGVNPLEQNCTSWVSVASTTSGLESGRWLKVMVTSPSGQSFNECANEEQCEGLKDNTYEATAREVISNTATIVMSPDHYYFGVEKGSPLLRLETDTTTADVLNIRACKGFGVFQNNPVDLRLISYDPSSKVKELVTTFTEIGVNPLEQNCTSWVSVASTTSGLESGRWLKVMVTSPSGQSFNECANEEQCEGLKDNTYEATAREVISAAN